MLTKKSSINTPAYRCSVCKRTFRDSTELLYHSYYHSQEWPHRCPFCNKGFAIPSYLEMHKRDRNIIRETYCRNCLRAFQGKWCHGMLDQLAGLVCCESCSTSLSPIEYITS
ncbi:hypothetical protein TNIN_241461 [Trichonephila inaurata madagascariensis]|uniref:C2H2-type domain-containing protein n=1 Tax=Trichonephila inaurata madagascariensis TaxID=2747483 RepID=A0A8X6XJA8_9ARAC|nr:hypothetical protein TNIN_241461 [Trichonephila inaurata madagascariensis]